MDGSQVIYRVLITKNGEIVFDTIINDSFDYDKLSEVVQRQVDRNNVWITTIFIKHKLTP